MIRYAITHVSQKTSFRMLTFANQGRNFYDSFGAAAKALEALKPDLREKVLGNAADTLEVRPVDCYENGDARSLYLSDVPHATGSAS